MAAASFEAVRILLRFDGQHNHSNGDKRDSGDQVVTITVVGEQVHGMVCASRSL
jgi:hypothetical protein